MVFGFTFAKALKIICTMYLTPRLIQKINTPNLIQIYTLMQTHNILIVTQDATQIYRAKIHHNGVWCDENPKTLCVYLLNIIKRYQNFCTFIWDNRKSHQTPFFLYLLHQNTITVNVVYSIHILNYIKHLYS